MLSERNDMEYTSQLIDDDLSVYSDPPSLHLIFCDQKLPTIAGLFQFLPRGELKSRYQKTALQVLK